MDLSSTNFAVYLPWLLTELSTSCFVAIDLELSGIPMSAPDQAPKNCSLSERYAEYKAAAEKYQILQVGLTICQEEPQSGTYILKPYNMYLSPMVGREVDINRDWTCMSSSMEFLLAHKFDLNAMCKTGIRYLSRVEETEALRIVAHKYSRETAAGAVSLGNLKEEDQKFLALVRVEINSWLEKTAEIPRQKRDASLYFNIPGRGEHHQRVFPKSLSSVQKWLVRQLVTAEYPALRSRNKQSFIQVDYNNNPRGPRNAEQVDKREGAARKHIQDHIGCRWLVEAMAGGDLSGLQTEAFGSLLAKIATPKFKLEVVASRLKARIKENRAVLVGHNCFTDLIYFYKCFIGPLPDSLEEFQVLIHDLFPVVVDTKYLATHDGELANANSSLNDVNRFMAKISVPAIYVDDANSKYRFDRCEHEAGYDSMLAAVAFIKLATQLQQGKTPRADGDDKGNLSEMDLQSTTSPAAVDQLLVNMPHRHSERNFEDFSGDLISFDEDAGDRDPTGQKTRARPAPALVETGSAHVTAMIKDGHLIPRLGSAFWEKYANKLRLFGTTEQTIFLGGKHSGDGEVKT